MIFELPRLLDEAAERALRVTRRTSFMLSGAQLGITVTGLLVGYVAEPLIGTAVGEALGGKVGTEHDVAARPGLPFLDRFAGIGVDAFAEECVGPCMHAKLSVTDLTLAGHPRT